MPRWQGKVTRGARRVDQYVARELALLTRSQIKTRSLSARLNGKAVKLSRALCAGDNLELEWLPPPTTIILPEKIPLDVLYEDKRVIVVNKPQGLVVHPGAGNPTGTLANALLYRALRRPDAAVPESRDGNPRPFIVHRLDKDTSGVIIAAYDEEALRFLAAQFKARTVRKTYAALVQGTPPEAEGVICARLVRNRVDRKRFTTLSPHPGSSGQQAGKEALTRYRLVHTWGNYSLLALRPRSGRTHQLRVHLRHLGNPILGDPLYGKPDPVYPRATLMLHALRLALTLPTGERSRFKAPLPPRFRTILHTLRGV